MIHINTGKSYSKQSQRHILDQTIMICYNVIL